MIMCFKKSDIAFNHEPTYWFQFFVVLLVVLKAESLSIGHSLLSTITKRKHTWLLLTEVV